MASNTWHQWKYRDKYENGETRIGDPFSFFQNEKLFAK
jgi:hypothetical protein